MERRRDWDITNSFNIIIIIIIIIMIVMIVIIIITIIIMVSLLYHYCIMIVLSASEGDLLPALQGRHEGPQDGPEQLAQVPGEYYTYMIYNMLESSVVQYCIL